MKIAKKWEEWPKIQGHGLVNYWDRLIKKGSYSQDKEGLKEAIQDYIKIYNRDSRAEDTMINNIQKKLRKPMDTEVHEYQIRVDLLMDYIDLLPSDNRTAKLIDIERKNFSYKTSPLKWREQFISGSRIDFYNVSIEDIKKFMIMKKKNWCQR